VDYSASDNVDLYVKAYWHDWDTKFTEIFNDLNDDVRLPAPNRWTATTCFWGSRTTA
jgi:hypothetical protein